MRLKKKKSTTKIGVDIVELDKIKRYSKRASFINKIFTKKEIAYAKSKKNIIPHLATAFAAKEAIFKALGTGWINGKEVEIIRDKKGEPKAVISGQLKKILKKRGLSLSLSFCDTYAVAFVVIQ